MPCYDPETHDRPIRLEKKIHYLTELLCTLCSTIQSNNPDYLPRLPEINRWWIRHREFDQIGEALEAKFNELGRDALTPEELSHYYARKHGNAENP